MKNVAAHSAAWGFLISVLMVANVFSGNLQSMLASDNGRNKITLEPFELFRRAKVDAASSIYEFLDNTVDKANGICNVDKAKLPAYQGFIFDRVSVGYSGSTTDSNAGAEGYNEDIIGELRNAEFVVEQNGRNVLEMPLAALHNPHQTTGQSVGDQYAQLGSFRYLVDDTEFTWKLKFPSGVTVPTGNGSTVDYNYLEVRLAGWRTNKKALA